MTVQLDVFKYGIPAFIPDVRAPLDSVPSVLSTEIHQQFGPIDLHISPGESTLLLNGINHPEAWGLMRWMDTIRSSEIGPSMMTEEFMAALVFLRYPDLVASSLNISGEELMVEQIKLAYAALESDIGKGLMKETIWLYGDFITPRSRVDGLFSKWKEDGGQDYQRAQITKPIKMLWKDAIELYGEAAHSGNEEGRIWWRERAGELEEQLKKWGWDITAPDSKVTLHDVMTNTHLLARLKKPGLLQRIPAEMRADVDLYAANHHIPRSYTNGHRGNLWERTGLAGHDGHADEKKVKACLLLQKIDDLVAKMCRNDRLPWEKSIKRAQRWRDEVLEASADGKCTEDEIGELFVMQGQLTGDDDVMMAILEVKNGFVQ